jgi:putative nucleotidyltransferase with HDIG domain
MMDRAGRQHLYAEVVQRLSGALRAASLYSSAHPSVAEHIKALLEAVQRLHHVESAVLIGFIGGEVIADDAPLLAITTYRAELIRYMQALGINRVLLERGVTLEEITTLVQAVSKPSHPAYRSQASDSASDVDVDFIKLPHLRAGRIPVDTTAGRWGSSAVTVRQVYSGSIEAARMVWESTRVEGTPNAPAAHEAVEQLADAVDRSQGLMIGLTGMKEHDEYTFTHMVNVSILTMAQARSLGIEGQQMRTLGLAAMLHDIGKVRTPVEILTKAAALTQDERAIIRRHPSDGAAILRTSRDMPRLAAIVAFEHHVRRDGTGYPTGLTRETTNLATALCGIADIYDAMRSKRTYQQMYPSDRIMELMARNDGAQFDSHLVRRFVDLMGVYPPATIVRLTSGEVAVVIENDGPDPSRPTVKVLFDAAGERLEHAELRSLWGGEAAGHGNADVGIDTTLDPATYSLDPLSWL